MERWWSALNRVKTTMFWPLKRSTPYSIQNHTTHTLIVSYCCCYCCAAGRLLPTTAVGCPIPHFSIQKGAHERPLFGRYAPSIRTSAEPTVGRAPRQTSIRQSMQHFITKVRTQRKTMRVLGGIWDRAFQITSTGRVHSGCRRCLCCIACSWVWGRSSQVGYKMGICLGDFKNLN